MSTPPWLEIQIHAEDIRRGVRYLFLSKRQAIAIGVAAGLAAIGLLGCLIETPAVFRSYRDRDEYQVLSRQRHQQGDRLQSLIDRMEQVGRQADELRLRMEKVNLAYGLDTASHGQGGFPLQPAAVPASIYGERIQHGRELQAGVEEQVRVLGALLEEVRSFEEHNRQQVLTTPSISPLRGSEFVLTSPYGTRRNPFTKAVDFHAGLDLAAPSGATIQAPAAGVVVFAGRYDLKRSVSWWRYGNLVVLRHDERFVTLFGHCRELLVKTGQRVEQGQPIATVGSTGWSTSPHLHYEVRRRTEGEEYRPVDPRIYILNHRWRDEERILVQAREAPDPKDYEPLPARFAR